MRQRLKQMLVKEFLQMLRDPRMRMTVFGMPVVQMIVVAFALTTDVTKIRTAVLDYDNTPDSRDLLQAFVSSAHFKIEEYPNSPEEIASVLDHGDVRVVLQVPRGFSRDLRGGRTARLQILADGTDSNTTSIVFGYASQIVARFSRERLEQRVRIEHGAERVPGRVTMETRAWFNPNMESRFYYVPGLIAVMLLVVSMILTSVAIVREKEIGTIEQILVTPIRRLEFILGKTVPFLITGYIVMTLMFLAAWAVFGIHVRGSLLLLYALAGVYLAGNLGVALLISVTASTQQQAMLTAFFLMMPFVLLSGFLFPVSNMPVPIQYATYLNPMRWFLEILRGVALKGVGVAALWPAIVGQVTLAVGFLWLAAAKFHKTAT